MLLGFASNWDATALGTLALAAVTAVSLAFGWRSLRQGQREVEEAHRPVVMPVVRGTFMDLGADGKHEESPKLLNSDCLVVPVENIGSGPALDLEATMTYYDDNSPSSTARGTQEPAAVAGLGVSAFAPLYLDAEGWNGDFLLNINYKDVAGKPWRTQARFVRALKRYVDVEVAGPARSDRRDTTIRLAAHEAPGQSSHR